MTNKLGKLVASAPASAPTAVRRTKEDEARDRRYRADDALRCLTRADEIRRDKQLMRDVQALIVEQQKALSRMKSSTASGR